LRVYNWSPNLIRKAYWLDAEALVQYLEHYHTERPHQGLGNDPPLAGPPSSDKTDGGTFIRHQLLGGLINVYRREAA